MIRKACQLNFFKTHFGIKIKKDNLPVDSRVKMNLQLKIQVMLSLIKIIKKQQNLYLKVIKN